MISITFRTNGSLLIPAVKKCNFSFNNPFLGSQVGYKKFYTASIYGTKVDLGEALIRAFQSRVVKRDEISIMSMCKECQVLV